jgi:MFS transporter, PPP family, 3-phenylpropionic acid transporter
MHHKSAFLQGVAPCVGFLAQPFWGWMADTVVHSRKHVYMITKMCSTICLMLLAVVVSDRFSVIVSCVVVMACFTASGVMDAHAIDFLGDAHRAMYGTIRVWTALSWGLGAVIMGHVTDRFGFGINFWLFGGMSAFMLLLLAFGLPSRSLTEQARYEHLQQRMDDASAPMVRHETTLWSVFSRFPVVFWLFEVAIFGCAISLVESLLFIYLQNDLQASTSLCGYTVGVTVLFELPVFAASEQLLQILGHDGLVLSASLFYAVRVVGYTLLTPATSHYVLALEILHGITFACMWVASVDFCAVIAPKEWFTTAQTVMNTTMTCVGGGIGSVQGGFIDHRFGFLVLYRGAGIMMSMVFLVHLLFVWAGYGYDRFLKILESERLDDGYRPGVAQIQPVDETEV